MSAPTHEEDHPVDPIEAVTSKIPLAIPLAGAVIMFLLALAAVTMA
jgi:hypothetical protein